MQLLCMILFDMLIDYIGSYQFSSFIKYSITVLVKMTAVVAAVYLPYQPVLKLPSVASRLCLLF